MVCPPEPQPHYVHGTAYTAIIVVITLQDGGPRWHEAADLAPLSSLGDRSGALRSSLAWELLAQAVACDGGGDDTSLPHGIKLLLNLGSGLCL